MQQYGRPSQPPPENETIAQETALTGSPAATRRLSLAPSVIAVTPLRPERFSGITP
jgi:hypothetical protein